MGNNKFFRPNGDINLQYNDAAESLPVHLDQRYGSLPATKATIKTVVKRYGSNGNSLFAQLNLKVSQITTWK
jgi:hypothetical protein